MIRFRSDNHAGVSPEIIRAIAVANDGVASAYGEDEATHSLSPLFSEIFGHEVWCFPVGTGIAANAMALAAISVGGTSILAHEAAHMITSEDGAVEFFTGGATLVPVAGANGLITAGALHDAIESRSGPISALSLTQLSEAGTSYNVGTISRLSEIARAAGARVHMDGARFANALVRLGCSPAEMSWKAGVDILSFGTSKNGTMSADAVLVFDGEIALRVMASRRRAGQLYSKMRFLSVQLAAYLSGDLWLDNARHANARACELADGLRQLPETEILGRVDGNMIFVRIPARIAAVLREKGYEIWVKRDTGSGRPVYRLIASFATTADEVAEFLNAAFAAAGMKDRSSVKTEA
jgi:threonine aldolase